MSAELGNALLILMVVCLCLLLWAVSLAGTFVDLRRRGVQQSEQVAWLALVALLPGLGLAAYLLSRLLSFVFAPPPNAGARAGEKRVTLLKKTAAPEPRTGTIPAADLLRQTYPDAIGSHSTASGKSEILENIALVVMEGPHTGEEFFLETLPASVGREPGTAVQLQNDRRVSRLHAEFYRKDGSLRIRDLRSTHGTFVNGYSISDKALEQGDKIELGVTILQIRLG